MSISVPYRGTIATIPVEIVSSPDDVRIGMTKYRHPPSYGMLFLLNDRYRYLTMKGMHFPIDILFMDRKGKILGEGWKRMYIGSENIAIPSGSLYALEVPVAMAL